MANAIYCKNNELLKNNFYFALSTASASNPTQLPSSHTGIADSGASGFYFAPNAPIANINSRAPAIRVQVANGLPVRSIASATLESVPSLPSAAMHRHVMPSFPHTLVGLGLFADQGCRIVFTKDDVTIIDPHGRCILKGWQEEDGAHLWCFPLKAPASCTPPVLLHPTTLPALPAAPQLHPSQGLEAIDDANQACSVSYQNGRDQYLAFVAQSTKTKFDPCSLDLPSVGALIRFYHACLGFPVKQTWLDATKAGNCDTFDGFTYSNIARYCPDSDETILGHLAQQPQNVRSTRPRPPWDPTSLPLPAIEPPAPELASNKIFVNVFPLSKLYTNDTGRFPVRACLGNQYIMIAYHADGQPDPLAKAMPIVLLPTTTS
jgi:hypothetical protein